ncbi:MAG TPA: ATP-binding protein [Chitinophagaceae bacterium]
MKRLLYFIVVVFSCQLAAQSFPVKNVNDEYVIKNLKGSEEYKNNIKEVIRDKNGLYWFQNFANISSFDGVNWKVYKFSDASGREVPVRINETEVTDDSTIWLATAEGMYGFNRHSQKFIPIQEMFPGLKGMPRITNCIYKGLNDFVFVCFTVQGFYVFNWNTASLKYVIIDSANQVFVPVENKELDVTSDKRGHYWGLTKENKGIWRYDPVSGKISRSWKGEILSSASQRLQGKKISGIAYSEKDDALWLSYAPEGILEKMYLATGKSIYYSFTDELTVRTDTNSKKRHPIMNVMVDRDGNEWILVASKYLVKLNEEVTKFEYLKHDPDLLPLGKMDWLLAETRIKENEQSNEDNLLWVMGDKGLSVIKKMNAVVKPVLFDESSTHGITANDYMNSLNAFTNIFFVNGVADDYIMLQPNPGRPKLIRFDKNLHITAALFNDKWKQNPAYFNPSIETENFYIALLRPGTEPLDFRNVVSQDFKVNLRLLKAEEISLSFTERIRRYGAADANNIYWLFANGYLYSFDADKEQLDSIFVCQPYEKQPYVNRIKGYDFPVVLHKPSGTFWISFATDKELYKIDLKKRKIDKVFRGCLDKKDCLLSSVFQLYNFDSSRIYLKLSLAGALLNTATDSFYFYSDLFKNKLPAEDYVGSFSYKQWIGNATASEVNLQNTVTGKQKRLSLNGDFKWSLAPMSGRPLLNRNGEMILLSSAQKAFVIFNLDSILSPVIPGYVRFSFIKLNERDIKLDSLLRKGSLRLKYNGYSSIHFKFSDYSLIDQDKIRYEYMLYSGGDTTWSKIEGSPELTLTKITPGNYKLLIRAGNGFGDYSPNVTAFNIVIIPPFTQTPWFIVLITLIVAAVLYLIYRYRLQHVKRMQIMRNNIASDLHDDIGSTLNSISIYSEVAKQQADKEIPALDLIGSNSRKIIESMSDIVWTINPENDSFEKIIVRMRSFAHQVLKAKKIEYTFEADEKLNLISLPMQVRKNFYLVFKEAITNLVKYSGASKVSISLNEADKMIILKVRDNGIGIPENPETQGNGLMNMKRRAEEIKAKLNLISANGEGTGVELILNTKEKFTY